MQQVSCVVWLPNDCDAIRFQHLHLHHRLEDDLSWEEEEEEEEEDKLHSNDNKR
jgi:hypothetical protein